MAKLIDLTGATIVIPSGWKASEGYGQFNILGQIRLNEYDITDIYNSSDPTFRIGYYKMSDEFMPYSDKISCSFNQGPNIGVSSKITLYITSGTDVTNQSLIQWFLDNNATIAGGVWEEDEPSQPSQPSILYKGNVIAILEDGKETVLKCKDWRMRGDIIVKWIEEKEEEEEENNLISFTIHEAKYEAEESMTWEEWVNSDYNLIIGQYGYNYKHYIYTWPNGTRTVKHSPHDYDIIDESGNEVSPDNVIIPGHNYDWNW